MFSKTHQGFEEKLTAVGLSSFLKKAVILQGKPNV